ncbi:MAG TPA: M48 family metalloprotease [Methylomirabilota bacterium]|nr:M48 family metalloprotease [Methylomirabilota bacterium]
MGSPPAARGRRITQAEAPALFAVLEDLRVKLKTPRIHEVVVTNEFNAAIQQNPRLGIFGWNRNYLIIGLPLACGLTEEQFKAVLAHECGHVSGNHGGFGSWIYRLRKTWYQLLVASENGGGWSRLIQSFLTRYAPHFNAYSFVLARANEYEADRAAADAVGRDAAASALVSVQLQARRLAEKYWPNVWSRTMTDVHPPQLAFTATADALRGPVTELVENGWLREALAERTGSVDTHPCLKDRLRGLGVPDAESLSELQGPLQQSAAATLFPPESLQSLLKELDEQWAKATAEPWSHQHKELQAKRAELARLEEKLAATTEPSPEELWTIAGLTLDLKTDADALLWLESLHQLNPQHQGALFQIGRIRLQQNDPAGIPLLEQVITLNPFATPSAGNLLLSYYRRTNQRDLAEVWESRLDEHYDRVAEADKERTNITAKDKFIPHALSSERVVDLVKQLSTRPYIKRAYLVRKDVQIFPMEPFFILAVEGSFGTFSWSREKEEQRVLEDLTSNVQFSGQIYVIIIGSSTKSYLKPIKKVETSLIWNASK